MGLLGRPAHFIYRTKIITCVMFGHNVLCDIFIASTHDLAALGDIIYRNIYFFDKYS